MHKHQIIAADREHNICYLKLAAVSHGATQQYDLNNTAAHVHLYGLWNMISRRRQKV